MLRPTIANEPDRDKRAAARARAQRAHRGAPAARSSSRRRRSSDEAVRELGAPNYVELHRRFGFRLDELAEQCRAFLDSTERLWEDAGDRLFRAAGRRRPRRGAALRRRAALPRARVGPVVPGRPDAAGARGDARRPRHRPARPGERPPRRRAAREEDAARVLRADRGAAARHARDPADRRRRRLARALPRGRPHRALRAHARRPARSRSGGSATTRSPRAGRC